MSDSLISHCNTVQRGQHSLRKRLHSLVLGGVLSLAGGAVTVGISALLAQTLEHRPLPLVPAGSDPQLAMVGAEAKNSSVGGLQCSLLSDPAESAPFESTVVIGEGQPAVEGHQPAGVLVTPDRSVSIRPQPLLAPKEQVEMSPLIAVDPDGIGVLGPREGGFSSSLWNGSTGAIVQTELTHLPVDTPSRAVHGLTRRLLATAAPFPGRDSHKHLLPLRLEKLVALGETDDVITMTARVPSAAMGEGVARTRVESHFVAGDDTAACAETVSANRLYRELFWHKAFIFCQTIEGRHDAAFTGLDLLREHGHEDPLFRAGIEDLLGLRKLSLQTVRGLTPLHVAVLRRTGKPLPKDVAQIHSAMLVRSLVQMTTLEAETRLILAERAEAIGVLKTSALGELYRNFTTTEAGKALEEITNIGVHGRAALYQLATATAPPRADFISRALALASQGDQAMVMTTVRLYQPILAQIIPAPNLVWFTEEAARLSFATDAVQQGVAWLSLAHPDVRAARVWPLARLVRLDDPWPTMLREAWRIASTETSRSNTQISALLSILDAMGDPVSTDDWIRLVEGVGLHPVSLPSLPVWHSLAQAAKAGRVGETLLLALVALGGDTPATVPSLTLHHVIAALRQVGLEEEARILAIEAMVARSL